MVEFARKMTRSLPLSVLTSSLTSHLFGHKPITPIKCGPPIGDCKPKFQQTPKKRPRVQPYSSVIQGNCNGTQRAITQLTNLVQIEK